MNKGDKRRSRRKFRVRYDRIVILALVVVALIVLLTSCVKAILKNDDEADESSNISTSDNSPEQSTDPGEQPSEGVPAPEKENNSSDNAGFTNVLYEHDDIYKGDLVLVNAAYEYKFPEGDIDLVTLFDNRNSYYDNGDFVTKLDRNVIGSLNQMMADFAEANSLSTTDIFIIDGYRTYDEQVERHSSGKSKTFEAGHSDYHTGRTFDMFRMGTDGLPSYFAAEGDCAWFAENAAKYGLIVRYPEGKEEATGEKPRAYTYRYIGAAHAVYMRDNGLCLEEYISELKKHTKDDPLAAASDGTTYIMYYVPAAESGATEVPVPDDKQYTVSGNNADGFIVTAVNN